MRMMAALASPSAEAGTAAVAWSGHDTWLLTLVGLSIAVVVVLIGWAKLHAFLALMLGAFTVSLLSGEDSQRRRIPSPPGSAPPPEQSAF